MTYAEIDRMIFEALRKKVVLMGYLPDVTLYANGDLFKAAREALKVTLPKHQLIDVMGSSSIDEREEKTVARFTIDRQAKRKGGIAYAPATEFTPTTVGNVTTFVKEKLPEMSYDIPYEIRIITNNIEYRRIMEYILDNALGDRRYMETIAPDGTGTGEKVLFEYEHGVNLSAGQFIEVLFHFVVKEVWLQESIEILNNIPLLTTVEYGIFTNLNTGDTTQTPDLTDTVVVGN